MEEYTPDSRSRIVKTQNLWVPGKFNNARVIETPMKHGAIGNGVADDGPAFNRAIEAAPSGSIVWVPAPANSYKIDTRIEVNKSIALWGGGQAKATKLISSGNCIRVSASNAAVSGLWLEGTRATSNHTGIEVTAAGDRVTISDCRIELFNHGIHNSGNNFHPRFENIRLRNIVNTIVWLQDGVGAGLHDIKYDTDTGTYAEPTTGGLVINCEGVQLSDSDFIHAGTGLLIEPPSTRSVEWCLFTNSFFDSCGTLGCRIRNNDNTRYIRGLFFNQTWFATNGTQGIYITGSGTGDIDGVYFKDCPIHNNDEAGLYVDYAPARNIVLNGCEIAGNNVANAGANGAYFNCTGAVRLRNNNFGRALRWTTDPLYHIYLDTNADDVEMIGNRFDANALSGNLNNISGTDVTCALNGAFTGSADAPVNGYITILDSTGTARKLATIA